MLQLEIPAREIFDDAKAEFIYLKQESLQLEHSLVSISKWEAKWCKPFLGKSELTSQEFIDYIRCMTISQNPRPEAFMFLPQETIDQVKLYVNQSMTATWFTEKTDASKNREIITSELIYYWMIAHSIPFECQKWHLNRLLTLIRVCNIKNQPPKKQNRREMLSQRAALNQARRNQHQSKG